MGPQGGGGRGGSTDHGLGGETGQPRGARVETAPRALTCQEETASPEAGRPRRDPQTLAFKPEGEKFPRTLPARPTEGSGEGGVVCRAGRPLSATPAAGGGSAVPGSAPRFPAHPPPSRTAPRVSSLLRASGPLRRSRRLVFFTSPPPPHTASSWFIPAKAAG